MRSLDPKLKSALLFWFTLWGAILMFAMEPLAGRMLLPGFGGGFHVWTTCLMFFQTALLAGYGYARWIGPRIGGWHLAVVALPLLFLPLGVDRTPDLEQPILAVLTSLLIHVAIPFGVLSTTGVMAQTWLARSELADRRNPYHLYAASNAGSLIGLLGYPFLIEPLLGLRAQAGIWTASYVLYALLAVAVTAVFRPSIAAGSESRVAHSRADLQTPAPSTRRRLHWFFLSAAPAVVLMAITNAISVEVGSLPMFWVLPLSLYLLTFILAFSRRTWGPWHQRGMVLVSVLLLIPFLAVPGWASLGFYLIAAFYLPLACHAELYRRRPEPDHLTGFYLILSLGGCAGGVFVAIVAPHYFPALYELGIGITLAFATLLAGYAGELRSWFADHALVGGASASRSRLVRLVGAVSAAAGLAFLATAFLAVMLSVSSVDGIFAHRNFYGIYAIQEDSLEKTGIAVTEGANADPVRVLIHGKTVHGFEVLTPDGGRLATGYYHRNAPIGDVLSILPSPKTVGVMGLGAGTMAAHFEAVDELVYYELDPDNERIARNHFRFLERCPARVRIVAGDARLALARDREAPGAYYDAIVIDAFSGDGIPTHLVTVEAIESYLTRLKPKGFLAFHISNRYYDLRPVLRAASRELGLRGLVFDSRIRSEHSDYELPSIVYALAREEPSLAPLVARGWLDPESLPDIADARVWTDDFVNPLAPLLAKLTGDSPTALSQARMDEGGPDERKVGAEPDSQADVQTEAKATGA